MISKGSEKKEEKVDVAVKHKEFAHNMPQSITTSPLSTNFQRKK